MFAIKRIYGREPHLTGFIIFFNEETILMIDPIFARETVQEYVQNSERKNDYFQT